MQNGLQLNPDCSICYWDSKAVPGSIVCKSTFAGLDLYVAIEVKVLGVAQNWMSLGIDNWLLTSTYILTVCELFVFILIILVLSLLICSPIGTATFSKCWVFCCIWSTEWDMCQSICVFQVFKLLPEIHWMPIPLLSIHCLVIQLITSRNRKDDNMHRLIDWLMHPCLLPILTSYALVSPPLWITLQSASWTLTLTYDDINRFLRDAVIPKNFSYVIIYVIL